MIYYIINSIGIICLLYLQYKRYKLIKDIKYIETKKTFRYKTIGWHKTSNPKETWDTFFILKEEIKSSNKKMTKFLVEQVIPGGGDNNQQAIDHYTEWFYKSTGGGWVKTNDDNLMEYEPTSIWEKRNKKLEELGIK